MFVAASGGEQLTVLAESQVVDGLAAASMVTGNYFFPVLTDN